MSGGWMAFIGFLLLLASFGVIFGMVINVIPDSLLLSFVAYGSSLIGVTLAFAGLAKTVIRRRGGAV